MDRNHNTADVVGGFKRSGVEPHNVWSGLCGAIPDSVDYVDYVTVLSANPRSLFIVK